MFIGFANFFRCYIGNFSKIAVPLISILKTNKLSKILHPKAFRTDGNKVVRGVDGNRANEKIKNLSKSKTSKNEKSGNPTCTNIRVTREHIFLTPGARKIFNLLKQAFTKAPIL